MTAQTLSMLREETDLRSFVRSSILWGLTLISLALIKVLSVDAHNELCQSIGILLQEKKCSQKTLESLHARLVWFGLFVWPQAEPLCSYAVIFFDESWQSNDSGRGAGVGAQRTSPSA